MKINLRKIIYLTGALLAATSVQADNFIGNGDTTFDGAVGNGVLSLSDNGTNFSGSLTVGGAMNDTLVIYIDTGASGGFSSTTNFNDQGDDLRKSISGVEGGSRSTLTFTNGFSPKYAIALGPNNANFGGLWQLANGNNNSLTYLTSVNLAPNTNVGPFTFSFPATAIGLTNHTKATLRIFGTYINKQGYRSAEAIAGNVYGAFGIGYQSFSQSSYATYTFGDNGAITYPTIFSVDMLAQIVSGAFKPLSGDTVYVAGSFQANPWAGFQLTKSVANTNIYIGTNQDFNSPGIAELYKFKFHSVTTNIDVWEFGPPNENRPYTTAASAQTLPLAYFNNVAAIPSATTNAEVFQIDLTSQVTLGRFRSGIDQVDVIGTFQTNQWSNGFHLTNNPTSVNTNLYSGTYRDGNYPGTWQLYKFVIVSNSVNIYESINNRVFYTPTNNGALSIGYFNNISPFATAVKFQVDMTVPQLSHIFNPTNGDTVGAAGTFQLNQWSVGSGGFLLTNNPTGANSNLYSGTYTVIDQLSSGEHYKFVINNSGGSTTFESPASTGGGDRQFILGSTSQTLSTVYWEDGDPINYLTKDTYITFTMNMNNALDIFGVAFDPANDALCVDGDFINPQWDLISHATVLFPYDLYSSYFTFQNVPAGSTLYKATYLVAAGHSLQINYKYGIYHNAGSINNTTVDNEAHYGQNHTRYIRTASTNSLPVDYFGIQVTNAAAAIEPLFGNLAIAQPVAGKLPVTWLGYPNVHLQTSTNLVNNSWQDVNVTTGLSSTNWPMSGKIQFFRLIQP